jgi:hypothetical protein
MDVMSLVIGAVFGWFTNKYFSKKTSDEFVRKIDQQTFNLSAATTFAAFERMLRTSKWRKEHIDNKTVWVCENDNTFQFSASDDNREFNESWTSVFPNQGTSMFHINLTMGGTIVKSLPFISADGGQYTLPLPEIKIIDGKQFFFWSSDSIEVKIAEIIGNFYRNRSLEEVAFFTKIELHTVGIMPSKCEN